MGFRLSFQIVDAVLTMDGWIQMLLTGNCCCGTKIHRTLNQNTQNTRITMLMSPTDPDSEKFNTRAFLERPPLRYLFIPPLCVKVGEIASQCQLG